MTQKKLIIYIPAYNAAITLPRVLDRIPPTMKAIANTILVVDNHSQDDTEAVALKYKTEKGLEHLHVIRTPENLGYGGSQKLAYRYCIDHGVDYVVMLHADGQYAPEILEKILNPMLDGKVDMVFGSRIKGHPLKGGMPFHRFLGNRTLTFLQNFALGTHLSEFHSGYRAFSISALKQIPFERLSEDYHFDTEMIILFAEHKLRIHEIEIPTFYGDEENYVNIWKYGVQVLVTTFSYFLHKRGLRQSRNWQRILG